MRFNSTNALGLIRTMTVVGVLISTVLLGHCVGQTINGSESNAAVNTSGSSEIEQLRRQLQSALAHINDMQKELSAGESKDDLEQQVDEERGRLRTIENRLDAMDEDARMRKESTTEAQGPQATPMTSAGPAKVKIYNDGFFLSTSDKSFSLYLNGLFQIRYTGFNPQLSLAKFGVDTAPSSNFDVYLGRLAVSGSVFSPTLNYFLQFQGGTSGNNNNVTLLDCFTAKTVSKSLTVQGGRSWLPYTYEFYVNPGDLLFADLPVTEYSFGLSRTLGVQAYGEAGKWSYAGMVGNSVPALDASGQQNFNSKVSYLGHLQYDILAPYGNVESDTTRGGIEKPELSVWISGASNPVSSASNFQNVNAGDRTANATSMVGFRYIRFALQGTGYYRDTRPADGRPAFNSWGYAEQSGLFILPGKLEFGERFAGVNWGSTNYIGPVTRANTWFAGPNFRYHRIDEDTLGANWYFHGQNAKLQLSYSYLHGNSFDGGRFGAGRIWVQTQVMF